MGLSQLGLSVSEEAVGLDFGNVPYAVQNNSRKIKEILSFSENQISEKNISNSRILCVAVQKIFFSLSGINLVFPGRNTESMSTGELAYYIANAVSLERFLGLIPSSQSLRGIFPNAVTANSSISSFISKKKQVSGLICSDEKETYNPYTDQSVGLSSRKFLKTCLSLMFLEKNFLKNKNSLSLGGLSTSYDSFLNYYSSFGYGMEGTPAIEYILSSEATDSIFKQMFGAGSSPDPDLIDTDIMPAESSENYYDFSFPHVAGLDEYGNIENYNVQTNQNKALNDYKQKLSVGMNKLSQDISKLAFNLEQNNKLFRIQQEYMNELNDIIFDSLTGVFNGENHLQGGSGESKLTTLSQLALISNFQNDDARMNVFLSLFADYLDSQITNSGTTSYRDYNLDTSNIARNVQSGPDTSYTTPYYRVNSVELSMNTSGRLNYLKNSSGESVVGLAAELESARLRCLTLVNKATINRNVPDGPLYDGNSVIDDPALTGQLGLNEHLKSYMAPPNANDHSSHFDVIVGDCFGNNLAENGLSKEKNIYTPIEGSQGVEGKIGGSSGVTNIDEIIGFSIGNNGQVNLGSVDDTPGSSTNNLSYYKVSTFYAINGSDDLIRETKQVFKEIFVGRDGLLSKVFDHAFKLYIYSLNGEVDTTLLFGLDNSTNQNYSEATKSLFFHKMFDNAYRGVDAVSFSDFSHETGIDLFTICYALFEYLCDMVVNSKAKFNIVITPPRVTTGTDQTDYGTYTENPEDNDNGNVYVETLKSEVLKLMSVISFTSKYTNIFFPGALSYVERQSPGIKGRDYIYNITDSQVSDSNSYRSVGLPGLRITGENFDEIRYRNLSFFARMYRMREKDISVAKELMQKLLDYRAQIEKFNSDLSSFVSTNYSFNSYINSINNLSNNALKKLVLNQINTSEHLRSVSTNYLKDYCMGKNSSSYQTFLTSNLSNSGPVQLKSMLKFFGNPGYGYLQSEKLGNQRTLFVGIPIGFLKLAQDKAYAETLDESYLNSTNIAISVYRKNEINPSEKVYPKIFVFDVSKYVLPESIDNVTEQNFSTEYSDADDYQSFLAKHEVFKFETDPKKADSISLKENFKKYKGKAFNNENSDANLSDQIKQSIFKNLVADYYLKMYYRIMLGIDVQESNFKVDSSIFDFSNPDADYQELYDSIYGETLTSLGIDPGSLTQEQINSSTTFRQISLSMRELKNSSLFKQDSNRRSVLIPDTFSRIFGLFFNERDFVIYRGDDIMTQPTDSQQDLFDYSLSSYVDLPMMSLDGQKSIKEPHLLSTQFENYSDIFSNKYKDYIDSMKTSGTSFYSYYCTVSLLKKSLDDDE